MGVRSLAKVRRLRRSLDQRGRLVQQSHGLSRPRQLAQMVHFFVRLGTRDSEYYDYRLYDSSVPLAERLTFLSGSRWLRAHPVLNPPGSRVTVTNKALFRVIMHGLSVPVPGQLGVLDLRGGAERRPESRRALHDILSVVPDDGVVIKPESGGQVGRGVLAFVSRGGDGALVHANAERYDEDRLWTELAAGVPRGRGGMLPPGRYLFQRRLQTARPLRALCPDTLCTARIVTLVLAGRAVVLGASYKVGVGRRGFDNYHGGSIAAPVDLETGSLGAGVREFDDERYEAHPESGIRFVGVRLPGWEEAVRLVVEAAPQLPRIATLGWDVALTDDGPVVLEANPDWSEDLIQRPQMRGIWRDPLSTAYEHARGRPDGNPDPAPRDARAEPPVGHA